MLSTAGLEVDGPSPDSDQNDAELWSPSKVSRQPSGNPWPNPLDPLDHMYELLLSHTAIP